MAASAWEYKFVPRKGDTLEAFQTLLNEQSADGWEYCGTELLSISDPANKAKWGNSATVVFKRPHHASGRMGMMGGGMTMGGGMMPAGGYDDGRRNDAAGWDGGRRNGTDGTGNDTGCGTEGLRSGHRRSYHPTRRSRGTSAKMRFCRRNRPGRERPNPHRR